MNTIALALIACAVSAAADTSYTPPPANGGPYPTARTTTTTSSPAPYPASGWKPSGKRFDLPARPKSTYLPVTETEPTTVEGTTVKEAENLSEFVAEQQVPDNGLYYVLLPDGRLQKVTYSTMPLTETVEKLRQFGNIEENKKQTGYVANVKYQDVEPINGPIYAYQNAPLVRIYK